MINLPLSKGPWYVMLRLIKFSLVQALLSQSVSTLLMLMPALKTNSALFTMQCWA